MKKYINYLLGIGCLMMIMSSCDTAGQLDSFTEGNEDAVIASWVSAPSGELLLSDPTTSVAFEVEFFGTSAEAFTVSVSDGDASGTVLNATTFGTSTDGNQNFAGSISLSDIFSALGTSASDYAEGDAFTMSSTVTSGGTVFPVGNAVERLNAVADFSASLPTETVSLVSNESTKEMLSSGSTDTLFLGFANDLTSTLSTLPTVTSVSALGVAGGSVSAVGTSGDLYYVVYTAGAATTDTISFTVSGASAVAATGFAMASTTLSDVYVIDNVAPAVSSNSSAAIVAAGATTGWRFSYVFSETVASVSLKNAAGVDQGATIGEDGKTLDYSFSGTGVTLTLTATDAAGNTLTVGTFTF